MPEYGIWSEEAGGFIAAQMHSPEEAEKERDRFLSMEGEEPEDLKIMKMCPYHEEQPEDGCEECPAEYGED